MSQTPAAVSINRWKKPPTRRKVHRCAGRIMKVGCGHQLRHRLVLWCVPPMTVMTGEWFMTLFCPHTILFQKIWAMDVCYLRYSHHFSHVNGDLDGPPMSKCDHQVNPYLVLILLSILQKIWAEKCDSSNERSLNQFINAGGFDQLYSVATSLRWVTLGIRVWGAVLNEHLTFFETKEIRHHLILWSLPFSPTFFGEFTAPGGKERLGKGGPPARCMACDLGSNPDLISPGTMLLEESSDSEVVCSIEM